MDSCCLWDVFDLGWRWGPLFQDVGSKASKVSEGGGEREKGEQRVLKWRRKVPSIQKLCCTLNWICLERRREVPLFFTRDVLLQKRSLFRLNQDICHTSNRICNELQIIFLFDSRADIFHNPVSNHQKSGGPGRGEQAALQVRESLKPLPRAPSEFYVNLKHGFY